jgi:hypothetical protein
MPSCPAFITSPQTRNPTCTLASDFFALYSPERDASNERDPSRDHVLKPIILVSFTQDNPHADSAPLIGGRGSRRNQKYPCRSSFIRDFNTPYVWLLVVCALVVQDGKPNRPLIRPAFLLFFKDLLRRKSYQRLKRLHAKQPTGMH